MEVVVDPNIRQGWLQIIIDGLLRSNPVPFISNLTPPKLPEEGVMVVISSVEIKSMFEFESPSGSFLTVTGYSPPGSAVRSQDMEVSDEKVILHSFEPTITEGREPKFVPVTIRLVSPDPKVGLIDNISGDETVS